MKVAILLAVGLFLNPPAVTAQAQIQDRPSAPNLPATQTLWVNGRVTTEDNAPPPETVTVVLECAGRQPKQANTDPKGNFSITAGRANLSESKLQDIAKNGELSLAGCDLSVKLPGYTAQPLNLSTQGAEIGVTNVGTIVLHPTAQPQAFAVSVSSLAAPEKAKAAFEKGEEQKDKGKWAAAVESFRKAIAVYPKYALAWLELGRVQATQHNFTDAQQSFQQSVAQDSKLVEGYIELAHLAAQQKQWNDLLSATDHLVQVHPEVPEFWFLIAAANFNLGNVKEAEAGVTKGLHLDTTHQIPQMEYLYALVLARQRDFQSAADHIAAYLKLSPKASDAPQAQQRLAEFQKLASSEAELK